MQEFIAFFKERPELTLLAYKGAILIGVIIAAIVIQKICKNLLVRFTHKHPGIGNIAPLLRTVTSVVIWIIAVLMILQTLGIEITPILAAFGVGGLAVALSIQDSLSNLFAGLHLIVSHQIKVGEMIELDATHRGKVVDILWRYTVLQANEKEQIIIPNSKIAQAIIRKFK